MTRRGPKTSEFWAALGVVVSSAAGWIPDSWTGHAGVAGVLAYVLSRGLAKIGPQIPNLPALLEQARAAQAAAELEAAAASSSSSGAPGGRPAA